MDDIKDIKPPIETPLWVWILIFIVVSAAIAALYVYISKKKNGPITAYVKPAWDVAIAQLNALHQKQYPDKGEFKLFYSELSAIIRHYLEARFQVNAPEMTTEEFLNYMKTTPSLTDVQKQALKEFLNGCDMVKFAKHEPSGSEAQVNFDLARKLIEETRILDGV